MILLQCKFSSECSDLDYGARILRNSEPRLYEFFVEKTLSYLYVCIDWILTFALEILTRKYDRKFNCTTCWTLTLSLLVIWFDITKNIGHIPGLNTVIRNVVKLSDWFFCFSFDLEIYCEHKMNSSINLGFK